MATKTDNATTFRIVAGVAAVLLLAAAALVYLQARGGGGAGSAPELAALSQAIPSQASRALRGEDGAFDQLDASVRKVASLRRGGAPGRSADWQQLESQASAILSKRTEVEAVNTAARQLASDARAVLDGSEPLLDRSGSTAIIQEFQQRADRIRQRAAALPAGGDAAATAIAEDVAFLRSVVDGLNGDATDLDIRPLDNAGRESAVVPLLALVASLEEQAAAASGAVGPVSGLAANQSQLAAAAGALLASAFGHSGDGGLLPDVLKNAWIPVGLLGLAILLVAALQALHNKVSVFERMAREQPSATNATSRPSCGCSTKWAASPTVT